MMTGVGTPFFSRMHGASVQNAGSQQAAQKLSQDRLAGKMKELFLLSCILLSSMVLPVSSFLPVGRCTAAGTSLAGKLQQRDKHVSIHDRRCYNPQRPQPLRYCEMWMSRRNSCENRGRCSIVKRSRCSDTPHQHEASVADRINTISALLSNMSLAHRFPPGVCGLPTSGQA